MKQSTEEYRGYDRAIEQLCLWLMRKWMKDISFVSPYEVFASIAIAPWISARFENLH